MSGRTRRAAAPETVAPAPSAEELRTEFLNNLHEANDAVLKKMETGQKFIANFPVAVGDVLSFKAELTTVPKTDTIPSYTGYKLVKKTGDEWTETGRVLSIRQIHREGNGLNLTGATLEDQVDEIVDKAADSTDHVLHVQVDALKTRALANGSTSTYHHYKAW